MPDAWHEFGNDLAIGPTGDIAFVDGPALTQQRVLRRLLTNQGDYIWQVTYGAGLAQFVGTPASEARVGAVVRGQIFKEAAVAQTPAPVIDVQSDSGGTVYAYVQYADAATGATQVLSFTVGNG